MNISSSSFGNMNFRVKRQKFGIGSFVLLFVFGLVFIAPGYFGYKSMQIDNGWTRVQGEVVDVSSSISDGSTMYSPVVQYEAGGRSYQVTSSFSSSSYPDMGEKRQVAYNPARPDQSKLVEGTGSQLFVLLFPVVGIGLIIIALYSFITSLKRSRRINHLMQTGQKLQGVLVDIQTNSRSNGNTGTYKIIVSAVDNSGTVQNYTSDSLSGIAGLAMADFRNNPIPIDVYIDSANPENYYVDISDIPNLTPQRIGELVQSAVAAQKPASVMQGQGTPPIVQQPQFQGVPATPPTEYPPRT